jgi:hypothetical protein
MVLAIWIGAGATALTDLWVIARRRWFGIPAPDFGLLGRWIAYLVRGRFHHDAIAATPSVKAERAIGWISHYLIGIGFAALLLGIWGLGWARVPTLYPAMVVGIGTVAAPFLLMQPGMGLGIAGSRTPKPGVARVRSIVMHAVFGLGLYGAACMLSLFQQW